MTTEEDAEPNPNLKNKILVILGDPRLPDPVKKNGRFNDEDLEVIDRLKQALSTLTKYNFIYLDNHQTLTNDLIDYVLDAKLVFNLCDEGYYNQPKREKDIPEILEKYRLSYTGAGPVCMQECFDKIKVLKIAAELNIPTPIRYNSNSAEIKFPVILKPALADGGVGITQHSVVYNHSQLVQAFLNLRQIAANEDQVLIQEFLTGPDLTIGLIGNDENLLCLPIIEEDYSILPLDLPRVSGYEAKWLPDSPYWKLKSKPAQLTQNQREIIEAGSKILFKRLTCRDYARFDWRIDQSGEPKLLEVNPNCGWCWDGHLAKMAGIKGWDYEKLLLEIIQAAEKRYFK